MKATAYTAAQAAFAASTTSGRLLGVQVTNPGTTAGASITIYDNATSATAPIIFTSDGTATVAGTGTATTNINVTPSWVQAGPSGIGIPFANGLWVVSTASTGGAGLVVFSEGVPNDGRPAI